VLGLDQDQILLGRKFLSIVDHLDVEAFGRRARNTVSP